MEEEEAKLPPFSDSMILSMESSEGSTKKKKLSAPELQDTRCIYKNQLF